MKFKRYRLNCDDIQDENEDLVLNVVTDDDVKRFDQSVYIVRVKDREEHWYPSYEIVSMQSWPA